MRYLNGVGKLVLAGLVLATTANAQTAPTCELDLHVVVDSSGSMDDLDVDCANKIKSIWGEEYEYNPAKPCWEMLIGFANEAHRLIKYACQAANQGDPLLSLLVTRCPGSGKDTKVILEPSNDPAAIAEGFKIIKNQRTDGYSCAYGSLNQARAWIKESSNQPILLFLTDGQLSKNDRPKSEQISATLREKFGVTLITGMTFPTEKSLQVLAKYSDPSLVFDATEPSSLSALSFRLGAFVTDLKGIEFCSNEQQTCLVERASFLSDEGSCTSISNLYSGLASCAGKGCSGMDLTDYKDRCLELATQLAEGNSSCAIDCSDIATHLNAQKYNSFDDGYGYDTTSSSPGYGIDLRRYNSSLPTEPVEFWSIQETTLSLDAIAPIVDNQGNVIAIVNDPLFQHGFVYSVSPDSGVRNWIFQAPQKGSYFLAQPVVGGAESDDIFIGDALGNFYRISESDGSLKQMWNLGPGRILSAAAIPNESPFVVVSVAGAVGVSPPYLHKLSLMENPSHPASKQAWKRYVCTQEISADNVVQGIMLTNDQSIIVACRSGVVERFSFQNGLRQWKLETHARISAAPAFDKENKVLYVVAQNSTVNALLKYDIAGKDMWAIPLPHPVHSTPFLSLDGSKVIVATVVGVMYSYRANTGSYLDSITLPSQNTARIVSNPAQDVLGKVALNKGNEVFFFDPDTFQVTATTFVVSDTTGSPLLYKGGVIFSSLFQGLSLFGEKSTISASEEVFTNRQLAKAESNKKWPVAAIVLTAIFGVGFIILGSFAIYLYRTREG